MARNFQEFASVILIAFVLSFSGQFVVPLSAMALDTVQFRDFSLGSYWGPFYAKSCISSCAAH